MLPWQAKALPRLVDEGGVVSFSTGLGKSRTAIEAMKASGEPSALIVTPALVREHWAREIATWWSEAAAEVAVIDDGVWAPLGASGEAHPKIVITSPEILASIPPTPRRWLILDEGDFFKSSGTKRTASALAHRVKADKVIALSATLVSKEPDDLHQVLDLVWPKRFGSLWSFRRRYMRLEKKTGPAGEVFGTIATGLREDRSSELAERLAALIHIALHDDPEVSTHLPPLELESSWLTGPRVWDGAWSGESIAAWQRNVESAKAEAARDLVLSAGEPCAILTHQREMAELIAAELEGAGQRAVVAHGGSAVGPRLRKVADAIATGAHLCSTMHALGIGIDLTRFRRVVMAELYWVPRVLVQAMGRFRRLSSDPDARVRVDLLCMRGSPDEAMSLRLRRRLEEQATLVRSGSQNARLLDALSPLSEVQALTELRSIAAGMIERDPYLATVKED